MDLFGIQALGDSSCSGTSVNSDMHDSSVCSVDEQNEPSQMDNQNGDDAKLVDEKTFEEKREELYSEYKSGLVLISRQQFDEAEELFERLINNELLNFEDADGEDSHEKQNFKKELVQLKYIILKNLALINTKETKLDHEKALNFLIQAAEIDATDACLWYEIGENAFFREKFLISRWAYEESLRMSPSNWPCLDKLVVLLFALGHYSVCLKHIFNALKMDKFYFNGLLLMKKIETFKELHYSQQIDLFQRINYEMNGIDLESLFDSFEDAEVQGQRLFDRIEHIKRNHWKRFVNVSDDDGVAVPTLLISRNIATWKDLGTVLLKAYESSEHRVHLPMHVCLEAAAENQIQPIKLIKDATAGVETADAAGFGTPKTSSIPANLPGSRSIKRKKFDSISNDDSQSKRRSLRKDNSGFSQTEKNIADILKKFVDENYLRDIQTFNSPMKKVTFNETVKPKSSHAASSAAQTSERERRTVQALIAGFVKAGTMSVHHMIREYLKELSLSYGHAWTSGTDEIYLSLFNHLCKHYDIFEAVLDPANDEKFLFNCSTILTYLEIEFSKFRELQQKHHQSGSSHQHDKAFDALNEQYLTKLAFKLHELDTNLERYNSTLQTSRPDETLRKESEFFELRISCLRLFTSLSKNDESGSEFQVKRIHKLLDLLEQAGEPAKPIVLPNSKIFAQISRDSVREFLKLNEKKKILNSNSHVDSMFSKAKYQEIIDHLEEFADTHKLPLEDVHFKPSIYVQLLKSYLYTNMYEKCGYFSRKFLRQVISHFGDPAGDSTHATTGATAATDEDHLTAEQEKLAKKLEAKSRDNSKIFSFIDELLEIIQNLLEISQSANTNFLQNFYSDTSSNSNSVYPSGDQLVIHETVWLMYQLISIFYDNSESASRYEQYRPIKPFVIIFDCLANHSVSDRADFISSVHEYLAKNRACRVNNGEFLLWSIDVLMNFVDKCEACNEKVVENESSNETNEEIDILNASDFKEKPTSRKHHQQQQQQQQASKKASASKCSDCDECNDLLEQSFSCLFGYKTKTSAKYLETHSYTSFSRIPYTLANSVNLYKYFKPEKLPEYDDLAKFSIGTEFYDFLREIIRLANPAGEAENADDETSALFDTFKDDFQDQESKDIDALLGKLRSLISAPRESQRDIYYLLADFNFKNQKPGSLASGYFVKDLIFNESRFDSWTALALITSSKLLEDYLEDGIHLKTTAEMNKFISMVCFSVNLFKRSLDLGANDSKIMVEYGSFMYQVHSYCSREIKYNEQAQHFVDDDLLEELETKKQEFLSAAFDAYLNASKCNKKKEEAQMPSGGQDECSSSAGSLTDKSNLDQADKSQPKKESKAAKSGEEGQDENATSEENADEEEDNDELWLYQYMLGKIKEKMSSSSLIESLQHYKQSAEYLFKCKAVYLKKLNYKSKGHLSVESNEVYYRIYALTLKRIEHLGLNTRTKELAELLAFLEDIMEARFVKKFSDIQLNEIDEYLREQIFPKSQALSQMPCKEVFSKCVVICIAGLNQILRRFPQHYRSWYRLAKFYSTFLDFEYFEIAKNLLLSCPNWSSFPYMPFAGLFNERNKTNFFNGIWRISNNSNHDQDLERGGSFWNHLYQVVRLLIDILVKTSDAFNLTELSKCLYQKPENDKKYLEDSQREFLADLSCRTAFQILKTTAHDRFDSQSFSTIEEFNVYQRNLVPILLDSFELSRVILKNCEDLGKEIEQLLRHLYIQFHPDMLSRVDRITMDDITRYCLSLEKKDKPNRAKPKK